MVITPALTLLFGVDLRYAIGASLVSAIATSSGGVGLCAGGLQQCADRDVLEVATVFGALTGALVAAWIPTSALGVILGLVLLQSAWLSSRSPDIAPEAHGERSAGRAPAGWMANTRLPGWRSYHVQRVKRAVSG